MERKLTLRDFGHEIIKKDLHLDPFDPPQKEKRNDTPISAKKDIMGDKTVRVRADLHHIIKIETAKNGGNVKEVMEIRLRSKLKSVLIVQYLKILYNRN